MAPQGNIKPLGKANKPFKIGEACTECSSGEGWCKNGLCVDCPQKNCECPLKCKNCGELDAENCKCICKAGWDGISCEKPCQNLAWG